ncbi:hypothetical protein FQA39_LY02216 [Lamprigera yunnana]|nr:hypothetical protein FQA39_LY02216 [Lamprigera yunnana]
MSPAKADYNKINRQAISAIEFLNAFAEHDNSLSSTDKVKDLQAQEFRFRVEAIKPFQEKYRSYFYELKDADKSTEDLIAPEKFENLYYLTLAKAKCLICESDDKTKVDIKKDIAKINCLRYDELKHELLIRGITPKSSVSENTTLVQKSFQKVFVSLSLINSQDQLQVCESKLNDLAQDIEDIDLRNADNEYERIYSRLLHIHGRLQRLQLIDGQEGEHEELCDRCQQLRFKVGQLTNRQPTSSQTMQKTVPNIPTLSILDEPWTSVYHQFPKNHFTQQIQTNLLAMYPLIN